MNKDIVLPSRRFIISHDPQRGNAAKINILGDGPYNVIVWDRDILPMARALIEIYESIEAEIKEADRAYRARISAEKKT